MSCRKLIESPETCVDDMLNGIAASFPQLQLLPESRSLVALSEPNERVAVISGGGAGHEPFCTGYVGKGMLTGAVSGPIFASPPSTHIHHTIWHVSETNKGGIVLVVPKYTGDVLNFGLAAEWARKDGIKLETVVVSEDCALTERVSSQAGSRGMCGHVFVYKITGQLALEGKSVGAVAETGRRVNKSMATMGLCTSPCSLPGTSKPLFNIQEGLVELGLGVHGEAGTRSMPFGPVSTLVEEVIAPIFSTLSLKSNQRVAVLINNLGGATKLEQWVITDAVRKNLDLKGIIVERIYADHLMTSLDMSGFQVCILRLDDRDWLRCLDAETTAPGWPGGVYSIPNNVPKPPVNHHLVGANPSELEDVGPELTDKLSNYLKEALRAAAQSLIDEQDYLNILDSGCGDGDCGSTLARLASGVLNFPSLRFTRPATLLSQLAALASTLMGGTSGAVYGLLFSGAGTELGRANLKAGQDITQSLAKAWRKGMDTITTYSTARQGDRTMLDALLPACKVFETAVQQGVDPLKALVLAVDSAREGCAATRTLAAGAGRASYVHSDHLNNVDAGAYGVSLWMSAFCASLREQLN